MSIPIKFNEGKAHHNETAKNVMRYGGYIIALHSRDKYCILVDGAFNHLVRSQDRGYLSIDECQEIIDMELS